MGQFVQFGLDVGETATERAILPVLGEVDLAAGLHSPASGREPGVLREQGVVSDPSLETVDRLEKVRSVEGRAEPCRLGDVDRPVGRINRSDDGSPVGLETELGPAFGADHGDLPVRVVADPALNRTVGAGSDDDGVLGHGNLAAVGSPDDVGRIVDGHIRRSEPVELIPLATSDGNRPDRQVETRLVPSERMSIQTSRVEEIATDLGEAITDLPEYEAFEAAKAEVEESPEVQAKIDEFERTREEFMLARQSGSASQEDLQELQASQEELHSMPVMAEYLEAKAALGKRLEAVNEAISAPLALDFGEEAGGCCQD